MNTKRISIAVGLLVTGFALSGWQPLFADDSVIVGNIRVEVLDSFLARIEMKGAEGFENRGTFQVINRDWPGASYKLKTNANAIEIQTTNYTVHVLKNATSLNDVSVLSRDGTTLYHYTGVLTNSVWFPSPSEKPQVWWFADTPRIVPPPWGLTPAPAGAPLPKTSGWDLNNNAPDIYVFVPDGSYRQLRQDFLKLTGPTEMPPLFAFGMWDSRWYNYSETTALKQVENYRMHKFPLDVLVCDTGWRKGGWTGYQPNTNLFPNVARFFREAHAEHVHIMFNDHPKPVARTALSPKELKYRFNGLSGLLNDGLDIWWYDRNWNIALVTPAPNLDKEVWGMRLYHDTTLKVRPGMRPLILANVDGIDNGIRHRPMDVAAHRFPIQWTGDIGPGYNFLRHAVENAVYSGVHALFPYESDDLMNQDLGGHLSDPTNPAPTPERYIRWMEYGALSPICRPHGTHNVKVLQRMPWLFGPEAEHVVRGFVDMRYRLLPVFYAAAHENYETGMPLLRRLDLYYPQLAEASRDDEYLLGKYILVAPVLEGSLKVVPVDWLKTSDGQPGLLGDYYSNEALNGSPVLTRTDTNVDFNWSENSPAPGLPRTHFSVRWTGTIQVPQNVGEVLLGTLEDDGVRVWIDGKQIINAWGPHDSGSTVSPFVITAGQPHKLRIEYQQLAGDAIIRFKWMPQNNPHVSRTLWIPPGTWINAWTGGTTKGPTTLTQEVPLDQTPIYIKSGAILPLAPQMQYTGEKPWNPITLDVYPAPGKTNRATLYEDDTITTAYQQGAFRNTIITASADEAAKTVSVNIGAANGTFAGALLKRAWVLRIHRPAGWSENLAPTQVLVNGQKVNAPIRTLLRDVTAMPFGDTAGAPDADIFKINLPAGSVLEKRSERISFAVKNTGQAGAE